MIRAIREEIRVIRVSEVVMVGSCISVIKITIFNIPNYMGDRSY